MHTKRLTLVIAIVAAAAIAPTAAAGERHASPTGSDTDCTSAGPCSIETAVVAAAPGDEVIVRPGDYMLTATLANPAPIRIHGVAGAPRPRLLFSGDLQAGLRLAQGSALRHLDITQSGTIGQEALRSHAASVDQVVVKASSSGACTAMVDNSTIRNSVIISRGSYARAACAAPISGPLTSASALRNVTAIATGSGGTAVFAYAAGPQKTSVNLVNAIAKGGPMGASLGMDSYSNAEVTIAASHSNWATYVTSGTNAHYVNDGGNQGTPPAFVDAAAGGYRQAPGSVTVDAGRDGTANDALDVDGDPRTAGAGTDIGADELVATPTSTPLPPADRTLPPTAAPTSPFAGVELVSRRLAYGRRAIAVGLRCPAGTVGRCSGHAKLTARPRRSSPRRVIVGRAAFSIAPGGRVTVRVRATRAGRRLLRAVPQLRGRAVNAARDGAGRSKTTVAGVTIRRRQR